MEGKVYQASLLNTYVSGDIVTDTSQIPSVYRIPGLMGIKATDLVGITEQAPAAEVQQVYVIGLTAVPTVIASTKYTIIIGNTANTLEGYNRPMVPINYLSPAQLTGTPSLDRFYLYERMATNINTNQSIFATAYQIVDLTHATDAGDNLNVGEVITGATSGATGVMITRVSATVARVIQLPGATQFVNGENIDDVTGSGPYAMTAAPILGQGLYIQDDAGYYPANGSRAGANAVIMPQNSGWANVSTMLVLTTAAVYSFGQGTRMAQDVPVIERTSPNLASGTWEMATNNAPVLGATYQCFRFVDLRKANVGDLGRVYSQAERVQVLWLQKTDASGSANANYAATRTAILALNP